MKTKLALCAVVMLVGVSAAAAQETSISLAELDSYFRQSERASMNWPWSVRTVVEKGDTPRGEWEHYGSWSNSVVPPDRVHLVFLSGRKGEFIHIGPISYSKAEDGKWSRSDGIIKGPPESPTATRRFGDGLISYTRSRTGNIIAVTVLSKPSDDADPLDTRTRKYVIYFADLDIAGRAVITGEESVIHNGTKWVRTSNIYTFNQNIRVEAPDERAAAPSDPAAVPVSGDAAKGTAADEPVRILSKPRPGYTDEARANGVQGTVIVKVTFEANGTIGAIEVVKGLELGLTEMTEEAVRKITFTPARKNGIPISVTRQLEFTFSIY